MATPLITRRGVLAGAVAAGGAVVMRDVATAQAPATAPSPAMRFVHLTDIHIQPERGGGEGFAAALRSLQRLDPKPAFIVTGGDHVMDAYAVPRRRAELEWDLYQKVLRDNTDLPIYPVLGNHDIWGWADISGARPADPGYGKAMGMERLGMRAPYYSFDAGGWHFICLDSMSRRGESYFAQLDEPQQQWLRKDLAAVGVKRPVCIISHIPVLSVSVFFDGAGGERVMGTFWTVPDAWMHRDAWAVEEIIAPYNVRLLLSGHIHLVDRVEYRGKAYICNGAVCGDYWHGPRQGFAEGYGVIDVWPDGGFSHQYVAYGWNARPR